MSDIYPYSIYYRNSAGEEIHFDEAPYSVSSTDIFDSLCTLNAVSRPLSEGCRVLSKYRDCESRILKINVFGQNQNEHNTALNRLAEVIGRDVEALTAGKLYVNGQYLLCYINGNEKQISLNWSTCTALSLTITPEYPYWCRERKFSYYVRDNTADLGGLKYPRKYPYRYTSNEQSLNLVNSHYAPCPMIITIYGPAVNPNIYIGNILCGLNITLADGEYAVINQITREIYCRNSNGETINIFNRRNKSGNVFEFAPPGNSHIIFSGDFGMDVTIAEQRSEPLWN